MSGINSVEWVLQVDLMLRENGYDTFVLVKREKTGIKVYRTKRNSYELFLKIQKAFRTDGRFSRMKQFDGWYNGSYTFWATPGNQMLGDTDLKRIVAYYLSYDTFHGVDGYDQTYISSVDDTIVDVINEDSVYIYDQHGEIVAYVIDEIRDEPEAFTAALNAVALALTYSGVVLRGRIEKTVG